MRFSVIIPAYNAADTLAACLNSVNGSGAEVIVIDDGSSDGSLSVVSGYPDVKLIRQENKGVSAARNVGIAAASGEYLLFVDADDTVFPDAISRLDATLANQTPDIVVMRSLCGMEERYRWLGRLPEGRFMTREDIGRSGYIRGSVCGCAFKRRFLIENGLLFDERLSNAEDTVFFAMATSAGGKVVFHDIAFYSINARPDSASRNGDASLVGRLGMALDAAARGVNDPLIRTRTCLSLIHNITDTAIRSGMSVDDVRAQAPIDSVFPLETDGLGRARYIVSLIRCSYPLFYRLKQVKMLLRKSEGSFCVSFSCWYRYFRLMPHT